jgi:hypothetical protein
MFWQLFNVVGREPILGVFLTMPPSCESCSTEGSCKNVHYPLYAFLCTSDFGCYGSGNSVKRRLLTAAVKFPTEFLTPAFALE